MSLVKGARPAALQRVAFLAKELSESVFQGFFGSDCTLVPVPRSAAIKAHDALWPGLGIAEALVGHGMGGRVQKLLVRTTPVRPAHLQAPGARPRLDELAASLEWRGDLGSDLGRVVLVDDLVTRGTTFLSARETIRKAQPWLDITAFAAVRTMSFHVVTEPVAPVVGSITLRDSGWGQRDP